MLFIVCSKSSPISRMIISNTIIGKNSLKAQEDCQAPGDSSDGVLSH